jgi:hypothetical protein
MILMARASCLATSGNRCIQFDVKRGGAWVAGAERPCIL